MSKFGIKPPAKAGWDLAGKHHQPVTHTWQSETNKHHLAPFFGCMVRKMGEEDTRPNLPCLCSIVPKVMTILKCHASVHTVELLFTQSYSYLHRATTRYDNLQQSLLQTTYLWASTLSLPHLFLTYPMNSCLTPTTINQCLIAIKINKIYFQG